jgi:hypothetical protein
MRNVRIGIAWLALAGLLILPACTTTNPSTATATYNSLYTIGHLVDTSMNTFADLYLQGKVTDAQWNQVATVHAQYRSVYKAALLVSKDLVGVAAPDDVLKAAAVVVQTVVKFSPTKG